MRRLSDAMPFFGVRPSKLTAYAGGRRAEDPGTASRERTSHRSAHSHLPLDRPRRAHVVAALELAP
jgi:hypothetical protein